MHERDVEIATADGRMPVFITAPEHDAPHATVIVYMDGPGIREELRDMARRIGTVGYYVMLPNLFYRDGGPSFDPALLATRGPDPEMDRLNRALSISMVLSDTRSLVEFAAADPAAREPIGTIGYCMGGRHAYAAAGTFPDRVAAMASPHAGFQVTDSADSAHLLTLGYRGNLFYDLAKNAAIRLAYRTWVRQLRRWQRRHLRAFAAASDAPPLHPSQGRAASPFREAGSALACGPIAAPGRCPGLPPVPERASAPDARHATGTDPVRSALALPPSSWQVDARIEGREETSRGDILDMAAIVVEHAFLDARLEVVGTQDEASQYSIVQCVAVPRPRIHRGARVLRPTLPMTHRPSRHTRSAGATHDAATRQVARSRWVAPGCRTANSTIWSSACATAIEPVRARSHQPGATMANGTPTSATTAIHLAARRTGDPCRKPIAEHAPSTMST